MTTGCWPRAAVVLALGLGSAGAAAIDLDDPAAVPLHFALETLSGDAVTTVGAGGEAYYHLEAPPEDDAITTRNAYRLEGSQRWYVRVDLDGMVFREIPSLAVRGDGHGSGSVFGADDAVDGGAGRPFVIYRLGEGDGFSAGLTFSLSIADTLAAPPEAGRHRAEVTLYEELFDAFDREGGVPHRAFGGDRVVVVVTSGIEVDISSGVAVVDVESGYRRFTAASSARAVLGSVAVAGRTSVGEGVPLYAARGGRRARAEEVIESVSVTVEGDMTFGTFDLRAGVPGDRCGAAGAAARDGVLALSAPPGADAVTTAGRATLRHAVEAFGRRHLCVRLPEPADDDAPPVPAGTYTASVRVVPPGGAEAAEVSGPVGEIRRPGALAQLAHLTTDERYEQRIVIVNRGSTDVVYEFESFTTPAGVTAEPAPRAAARTVVPGRSTLVLDVVDVVSMRAEEAGPAAPRAAAASLRFQGRARDIDVATVLINRGDGSTDTVVYRVSGDTGRPGG